MQKCHNNISEIKSLVTNLSSKTKKINNIESTLQKDYDEITKTNLITDSEVIDLQAKISQTTDSQENEPSFLYRFLCFLDSLPYYVFYNLYRFLYFLGSLLYFVFFIFLLLVVICVYALCLMYCAKTCL